MKKRLYALLIHLGLSSLIAGIAVVVVFFCWYPAPLHKAIGVTEIFWLLLTIDVSIGPLCTFLVYKPGKPSLRFDLTVIALCQLAALSYGMVAMFEGRPAFVVFSADRFDVVRALDIDPDSAKNAIINGNPSATPSWLSPMWVGAVASPAPKRRNEITFISLHGGPDWPQLPELYVPLEQLKTLMLSKAKALEDHPALKNGNHDFDALLNPKDKTNKWLPLHSRKKDMTVLIKADTAEVVTILDLNPW